MTTAANYGTAVEELYISYFGRPADYHGLLNFEAALAAAGAPTDLLSLNTAYGTNPAVKALIDSFGTSAESEALYGSLSASGDATAFVKAVFENLFNRAPASAGLTFWVDAITSGQVTPGNAALAIAAGAAANSTPQGILDATTVSNKVAVASDFTGSLTTPADIAGYSGANAAEAARAMIATVNDATSVGDFHNVVLQTVAGIVDTPIIFNLTTAVDNVLATGDDNIFNAVLDNAAGVAAGGAAATLNVGDHISGGPLLNTLNIDDLGRGAAVAIPATASFSGITTLNLTTSEQIGTQDFSLWSGLAAVNVNANASSGNDSITVGASTVLSVNDTGVTGSVTTNGGSKVSISTDAYHDVTVNSGTGSGVNTVEITGGSGMDLYGTASLTNVSFNDSTGTAHIYSDVLNTLSITNSTGLAVYMETNQVSTAPMTVTLDGDSATQVETDTPTVLTINAVGTASNEISLVDQHGDEVDINASVDLGMSGLNPGFATKVVLGGSGNYTIAQADISAINFELDDTGTGVVDIAAWSAVQAKSLVLSNSTNTAGATFTVDGVTTQQNLQGLTLSGNVGINLVDLNVSANLTVSGATDNANVTFDGAYNTAAGNADSIVLGNGQDSVTTGGAAGSSQLITLGSGANDTVNTSSTGSVTIAVKGNAEGVDKISASGYGAHVQISTGDGSNQIAITGKNDVVNIVDGSSPSASLGSNTITLGDGASGTITFNAHTGADSVTLGAFGATPNLTDIVTIQGLNPTGADSLAFSAGAVSGFQFVQQVNLTETLDGSYSLSDWIAAAVGLNGSVMQQAHGVDMFNYNGNTYLVYTAGANDAGVLSSADTVVELSGTGYSYNDFSVSGGAIQINGGGSANGSYVLTTGVDNLNGTTFTAVLDNAAGIAAGGPASTLTSGDSINAGFIGNYGYGIFYLTDYGLGSNTALPSALTVKEIGALNLNSTEGVNGGNGTPFDLSGWTGLSAVNILSSAGVDNIKLGGSDVLSVKVVDAGPSVSLEESWGLVTNLIKDSNYGTGETNTIATVSINTQIVQGAPDGSGTTIDSSVLNTLNLSGPSAVTVNGGATTVTANLDQANRGSIEDNTATTLVINALNDETQYFTMTLADATKITINDAAGLTIYTDGSQLGFDAPKVTSLVLSGIGLFSSDLSELGATASINASALSGALTVTLSAAESLTGGSGIDIVTVGSGHTGALNGGSATANELILNNEGSITEANIPAANHFSILGLAGGTYGTFDLSKTNGFTGVDVQLAGGDVTIHNASASTPLSITDANHHTITWQTSDSAGVSDTATLLLGNSGSGFNDTANVTLEDSKAAGIGAVNLVGFGSNDPENEYPNTLNLSDTNLTKLGFSGVYAANVNLLGDTANSLTITDTSTEPLFQNVLTIADSSLTSLTFSGTSGINIGMSSFGVTAATITDNSTGVVDIGNDIGTAVDTGTLTSLTLTTSLNLAAVLSDGNDSEPAAYFVARMTGTALQTLDLNGNMGVVILADAVTGNINVAGASDNAVVDFTTTNATVAGATVNIALGNGLDSVTLAGGAVGATHTIALGSGGGYVQDINQGSTTITATDGAATQSDISTGGGSANISLGNGLDNIDSYNLTSLTITAGNGNDIFGVTSNNLTLTVGDGNNKITASGTDMHITAGNGANTLTLYGNGSISLGSGSNNVGAYSNAGNTITFAQHSAADNVSVGMSGGSFNPATMTFVSGLNNSGSDTLTLGLGSGTTTMLQVTDANVLAAGGSDATLANWVAAAVGQGGIVPQSAYAGLWFQFQGNTYVIQTYGANDAGVLSNSDSIVELAGTGYSFAHSSIVGGVLHLHG